MTPPGHKYFELLGRTVTSIWESEKAGPDSFSDIAARALNSLPPHPSLSFGDTVILAAFAGASPDTDSPDTDSLSTVVFRHEEFEIALRFSNSGSPRIEDGSFVGAVHVLEGACLHIEWDFSISAAVYEGVETGRLRPLLSEILYAGQTRPVQRDSICSYYYFTRPSVSVVIRLTYMPLSSGRIHFPPGVRCSVIQDQGVKLHERLSLMLVRAGRHSEAMELIAHVLEESNCISAIACLLNASLVITDFRAQHRLISIVGRRFPPLAELLGAAVLV
jgi:hypothetical protein